MLIRSFSNAGNFYHHSENQTFFLCFNKVYVNLIVSKQGLNNENLQLLCLFPVQSILKFSRRCLTSSTLFRGTATTSTECFSSSKKTRYCIVELSNAPSPCITSYLRALARPRCLTVGQVYTTRSV